ncbi:MAG: CoA-binding protein [Armatimonadetes bacterium]|nr:CoA-binding protein [Armatimonadota bacterium]NIM24738.1 CoA-binding protein [Armatimonadota bacterium]NIM68618.1 CoA-binding protein [Armatimonadota bacterium]NIM77135.1 CoA-binding protein [Armatimonadota bacterium]NIN06812.1 CoA-binding protein [Armatimonadota bacterium]
MLDHFFKPKSVAIVGASRQEGSVGHSIFRNMISAGFNGEIYGINPKGDELLGQPLYTSLSAVGKPIDLAIIAVPAKIVPAVMEECGKVGIDSTIIISAGFKETGPEGAKLERRVAEIAAKNNTRMIGPNCLGIVVPAIGLNGSFAAGMPRAGRVALISQSGALATAILDWALGEGLGFSKFVSFGNAADVGLTDLLRALAEDDDTKVVLAYLEGVEKGPEFMAVARELTRRKPLVVVKSGSTSAGARAVSSHTGSLAGSEQAYDAAFRQSGVIRVSSLEQLYDYAVAFAALPQPQSRNVALITNAGGPGIMATDAAERMGLNMTSLDKGTIDRLRAELPPASNFYNPVDVLGDASPERYEFAAKTLIDDPNVHNLIMITAPQAMTRIEETANVIARVASQNGIPIIGCLMGGQEMVKGAQVLRETEVPCYAFPERAVGALAAMAEYKEWQEKPKDEVPTFGVNREQVKEILDRARAEDRVNLGELEARDIISAYGFRVPKGGLARSPEEAADLAAQLGFPVVMKIASPDIIHKSDIGGVRLGINSRNQAIDAYELMIMRARRFMPEADIRGASVQEMVTQGKEVILGMSRDPQFGPLIMFGLGGIYVEVLKDVVFRVAPFGKREAREMIGEIRAYPLLAGVRGERPADINAIEEALLRLSQLVSDFPEIVEMDINPLKVGEPGTGAVAIDARITIATLRSGFAT